MLDIAVIFEPAHVALALITLTISHPCSHFSDTQSIGVDIYSPPAGFIYRFSLRSDYAKITVVLNTGLYL